MAVIVPDIDMNVVGDGSVISAKWSTVTNGDTGTPLKTDRFVDRSIQVDGTFGSGAVTAIEGSNDLVPTTWFPVTDPQGLAISATTATGAILVQVTERTLWIRPSVTAGATASLDFTLVAGMNNNLRT